jgi:hypothetical protein
VALLTILLLILFGFFGGSSSSSSGSASASSSSGGGVATAGAARRVTLADSGSTLTLAPGEEVEVYLPERWTWAKPVTTGTAVHFYGLDPSRDGQGAAWSLFASQPGRWTFRTTGRPGGKPFTLAISVR